MASLNRLTIIGNLGKDPEMKYTPAGNPVTTFSVACTEVFTSNEEKKQITEWFNVVAWNKLAETCNSYLNKGKQVYIEGKVRTKSWEGNDGQKHYKTEVIADKVIFLGAREQGKEGKQEEAPEKEKDDIPF